MLTAGCCYSINRRNYLNSNGLEETIRYAMTGSLINERVDDIAVLLHVLEEMDLSQDYK